MSFTSSWRDVYLAAAGRAVSRFGDFLAAVTLVLTLQDRGAGGGAVAALLIATAVPPVVLARWSGRLADRADSRRLLVAAGLAQAAVCLVLVHVTGVVAVVVLVAALGCGLAVTQPVLSALLPAMVRPEDLGRANALNQTASSVGGLAAPAVAGLLTGGFGVRVPLYVDAASYLVIVLAGLLIRTRRGGTRRTAAATAGAWSVVRSDTLVWTMIALVGVVVAAVAGVNVAEVFLVRAELGASATAFGLISATWTAGMIIGGWLLVRRDLGDARLATALLLMFGLTSAVVGGCGLVPAAGWLAPLFLLGGVTNGAENVAVNLLIARRIPPLAHGGAFAVYGAVGSAASVLGFLAGGVAVGVLPVRLVFLAAGALGVLATAALIAPVLRAARSAGQLPDRRATQATA